MKNTKITKRLSLHCETLRSMQLREVTGGTYIVPTKPQASCFIACSETNGCPTGTHCVKGV